MTYEEIYTEVKALEDAQNEYTAYSRLYGLMDEFLNTPKPDIELINDVKYLLPDLAQMAACMDAFDRIKPGIVKEMVTDEDFLDAMSGIHSVIQDAADLLSAD